MEANAQQKDPGTNSLDRKVCFVILHYLAYEETKTCVESILRLQEGSTHVDIVIVDNNSSNGSYERLKKSINNNKVHFIHNKDNLGFAKGMNVGYRYARNVLKSDVIALMNNDLEIKQSGFLRILNGIVDLGYDVIGPDIITGQGKIHVNPQVPESNYKKAYLRYALIRIFFTITPDKIGSALYSRIKEKLETDTTLRSAESDSLSRSEQEAVQLHGACLVFANKFVRAQEECLDERTFLYHEEDLLFQFCMRNHYRIVYTPRLKVYHEGGVSTGVASSNMRSKKIRNLKHHMKSIKYVISDIKKYGRYYPNN